MTSRIHLVIAGTTKAATTSLFEYLSAHPQVCASKRKESRFFLDPSYPAEVRERHLAGGIEGYDYFFDACSELPVRLEATPDYLYSEGTAERLQQHLSSVRLVFVLRDPIDRLVSWYRFARQNNTLPLDMGFEDYVERQFGNAQDLPNEQQWRALEQGRYLLFLDRYRRLFDSKQMLLIDYHALIDDPAAVVKHLCRWCDLDASTYDDYDFRVFNRTHDVRSSALEQAVGRGKRFARRIVPAGSWRNALRNVLRSAEPLLLGFNRSESKGPEVWAELRERLEHYYRTELAWLASGSTFLPWPDRFAEDDSRNAGG